MADGASSRPLLEDPAVKEYLALMEAHNAPGKEEALALFRQIAGMEKQLNAAVAELAAMRKELAEAREGPVKRTLTKAVKALEQAVSSLRERLNVLKESVIEGCKRTVEAFKERGASALAHTAEFFHIRPALEAVGREADKAAAHSDKALAAIREAGANYHEAGRNLRNAGRALLGREPITEAKGPGRLAHVLESSCKREKAVFSAVKRGTTRALDSLSRLEHPQERKPSIHQTMRELNEKIAREQRDKPAPAVEHEGR